ncbi:MAG: hypothetical protein RIS70_871, partial [Planctomycetota bacterium]
MRTFFSRWAIPILMLVFFLVPFAMRGARSSVQSMKNDVKNWLPSTFKETAEMEWFWQHFLGERFIVASWPECKEGSESYELFMKKLLREKSPSQKAAAEAAEAGEASTLVASTDAPASDQDAVPSSSERAMHSLVLDHDKTFIGDRLELFCNTEQYLNWGGRNEKWLRGKGDLWYFLTPDGELYAWSGAKAPLASFMGQLARKLFGGEIKGEHVASFSPEDAAWYYENPRRLNAQYFKTVTTGPSVLAGLTDEKSGVLKDNPTEAGKRLRGCLFGRDGKQTCCIITLTDAGLADFHRVIGRGVLGKPTGRLYELAGECGIKMTDLHIGGPPVDNVAIDEEGTITLVRLVSLCVILGVGLAYACFRTISATAMVFVVGGVAAIASLAIVGWFGSNLDAVLMSMPALVYVLGISGAAHLINYYREAVESDGYSGAPEAAVKHGWKPALLCNLTTALGLFSLFTSDIVPIRKFGVFSGIAVMATLILLFTYLPAALQIWPQRPRSAAQKHRDDNPWYDSYLAHFWDRLASFIIRNHVAVAVGCTLLCIGVGWGVSRINTTVNMLKMFDSKAKILADYAWLETNIGKLVPMEVVVKVPAQKLSPPMADRKRQSAEEYDPLQLSFLERMQIVDRVQQVVEAEFGEPGRDIAGRSMSAVTFAPVLPEPKAGLSIERYAKQGSLEKYRDEFLKTEYLRMDKQDGSELWRISLRIGALQDVDYGEFVKELKEAIDPVIAAQAYRDEILKQVIATRGDTKLAKASVCILGAPLSPKRATMDEASRKALSQPTPGTTKNDRAGTAQSVTPVGIKKDALSATKSTIAVDEIMAVTLRDLLKGKLRVDVRDPIDGPLTGNWREAIKRYDCVVIAGDASQYDLTEIASVAKSIVDLRDRSMTESETATSATPAISAVYTGVVPIVYKAQRTLLNSLIESTFWSFVTITPLMMLVSRSILAGLVAMLPNVLPVFIIFGTMGWMGIQVDIGSMMTASIALGVAVDDTIHYLSWYRAELDEGTSRPEAILATYKRCATPTFQAALISG